MELGNGEVARERLTRVFKYLKALNELRNPARRRVQEQPWVLRFDELPEHPAITRALDPPVSDDPNAMSRDFLLRVGRAEVPQIPAPPARFLPFLAQGWDEPDDEEPRLLDADEARERGLGDTVPEPDAEFQSWLWQRALWRSSAVPASRARRVFERLYELHALLAREAGRLQLVLGDGVLRWNRQDGDIDHPVLLQVVELEFDPSAPAFLIKEGEKGPDLYTALFRSLDGVDGAAVGALSDEVDQVGHHPLGGESVDDFLRRLVVRLSPRGHLTRSPSELAGGEPSVVRQPVLFARHRTLGFATALEAVLEDIKDVDQIPNSLVSIVGESDLAAHGEIASVSANDEQILLTKPANAEQLEIAARLAKYGSVLVQGPPGTGKTHTIANLIGHLLANGKSVLVTSHTTKALTVLRDKVVPDLQPLCVAALDRDAESRDQLRDSILAIVEKLSSTQADTLEAEANEALEKRAQLLRQRARVNEDLRALLQAEYTEVVVGGQAFSPAKAARLVAEGAGTNDWIQGPVEPGVVVPLAAQDIAALYETNGRVSDAEVADLGKTLPEGHDLCTPAHFRELVRLEERGAATTLSAKSEEVSGWPAPAAVADASRSPVDSDAYETAGQQLRSCRRQLDEIASWEWEAVQAGPSSHESAVWIDLLALVDETSGKAAEVRRHEIETGPEVDPQALGNPAVWRALEAMYRHVDSGRSLGRLTLARRPTWRRALRAVHVAAPPVATPAHLRALLAVFELRDLRERLTRRWRRQIVDAGGDDISDRPDPESLAIPVAERIRSLLSWQTERLAPVVERIGTLGPLGQQLAGNLTLDKGVPPDVIRARLEEAATKLSILAHVVRGERATSELGEAHARLLAADLSVEIVAALALAMQHRDPEAYAAAFEDLRALLSRRAVLEKRQRLLASVWRDAPNWAESIASRTPPHDLATPPGDTSAAWLWRQLAQELDRRHAVSIEDLLRERERAEADIRTTTAVVVEKLAWASQLRRISPAQRQALVGWQQLQDRIGKGKGKRVPLLQYDARKRLAEARGAVPVWIMPLARVAESFDARRDRFDVVIIDEASQCDVMGLLALYLGRQALVVGDDEQVSPVPVAQRVDEVQNLIDFHLAGIPNKNLYDGRMSVYDLALSSFGGLVKLREHFRCCTDIIQFSNYLSYSGAIVPLRDDSSVATRPFVVPYRVESGWREGDTNAAEARFAAALCLAALEQPEYDGRTFGVISMVKEDQARSIDTIIRRHIEPQEYERRKLMCGNPAHFQGDERDVVFLSLVASPEADGTPLRIVDAGYLELDKKRFNVAASRARDQLWVLHSMDPARDLRSGDLRRRLIEHVRDPRAVSRSTEEMARVVESEFERLVAEQLISGGFRVRPQWPVGPYRIDMVVEGRGGRLAIECDGDEYHPIERLGADLERQALLERLGWRFVRLRGSEFFRDRSRAMQAVYRRLGELGIEPDDGGAGESMSVAGDLVERVSRRASELLESWPAVERSSSPPSGAPERRAWSARSKLGADASAAPPPPPAPSYQRETQPRMAGLNPAECAGGPDRAVHVTLPETPEGIDRSPAESSDGGSNSAIDASVPAVPAPQAMDLDAFDPAGPTPLAEVFRRRGLKVIDNRSKGGALWVIDGPEVQAIITSLREAGIVFVFKREGSTASGHRPAWWTGFNKF